MFQMPLNYIHQQELICHGIIFTSRSCYMEHSQANINGFRSDHEEADSRVFAHAPHEMELYSPGGIVI